MRGQSWLPLLLLLLGGCAPETADRREILRQALQIPLYRGALSPRLVETWKQRDLVFEQLRFQGREHQWIEALAGYSELAWFRRWL